MLFLFTLLDCPSHCATIIRHGNYSGWTSEKNSTSGPSTRHCNLISNLSDHIEIATNFSKYFSSPISSFYLLLCA